ncbi:hypothetical protein A3H75_00135 [Candidatus Uhrbacteria bacterium RIFCSPLOWO2_02_FULL_51_9]|uniref:Transcription regulator TrmB N-terminal domain-containing protein n=1 Tax=Candidatus Uhrbacteria bacterium RIFCSPLOWO2_02_FULL_51_9 TaxID=1802410 RepID=A0A1F7VF95_9BACT|nr:MAG: hypothetical protein A3H75_00135 [Candidatus Uhrbacteria bacterium RIFCSPLOWO2_02_FULL_51_9]
MKDITPILRSLGLLDSEIKTYVRALEHGPATVLELVKASGLSRQATYVAIQTLTGRGLMSSALHAKKRLFAAEHPDKLLAYAERREVELREHVGDLKRLVPELELRAGGEKPVVKVFEGKEGINAIIEDMRLDQAKVTFEITDLEAMRAVLTSEDLAPLKRESKKMKRFVRGLYAGEMSPKAVDSERFALPDKYGHFKSHLGIYGNKVALVTFEGKMYSVIIESGALAKALHTLFELAFESAKNFPKK